MFLFLYSKSCDSELRGRELVAWWKTVERDDQVALNLYHREKTPPDTKLQEKGGLQVAPSVCDLLC